MAEHRIVHLGIGNFHRAHQAWYTSAANEAAGTDWRITGVSLRSPDVRDALAPQDYAYTLEIDGGDGPEYAGIAVHDGILVAPENPGAVVRAIADPATAIVSLTVTEKGYCLTPADYRLDTGRPDIRADLAGLGPTTAIGLIVAGLAARRQAGASGLTVLSCDNLPHNGKVVADAVLAFARLRDPALATWIAGAVTFPSTMVDRITPATTDALRDRVRAATGQADRWPVATERFTQWAVEDRFAGPRPAWETVGAEMVADVRPYEIRKLRMLNGGHSTLAYAGLLAGKAYVSEAVADPALLALARDVMEEAAVTLPDSVRASAPAYADALIVRFRNPGVRHALTQIAMDGSQKLPVRLLPTLDDRLRAGLASPAVETAIAAWLAFVWRQARAAVRLNDPLADRLAGTCGDADSPETAAGALLADAAIFGTLAADFPEAAARIAARAGAMA